MNAARTLVATLALLLCGAFCATGARAEGKPEPAKVSRHGSAPPVANSARTEKPSRGGSAGCGGDALALVAGLLFLAFALAEGRRSPCPRCGAMASSRVRVIVPPATSTLGVSERTIPCGQCQHVSVLTEFVAHRPYNDLIGMGANAPRRGWALARS